jgi:hypothetical protein
LRARLRTQLLLLGHVTLLRLSLPLKQPLLALQFALRVSSLRSSSLQLLHALLQPIDSTLALGTLPRQRLALPLLCYLPLICCLSLLRCLSLLWRLPARLFALNASLLTLLLAVNSSVLALRASLLALRALLLTLHAVFLALGNRFRGGCGRTPRHGAVRRVRRNRGNPLRHGWVLDGARSGKSLRHLAGGNRKVGRSMGHEARTLHCGSVERRPGRPRHRRCGKVRYRHCRRPSTSSR